MTLVAASLALLAGALFGLTVFAQSKGLEDTDAFTGAFLSIGFMACLLWIFSPAMVEWHWMTSGAALIFLAGGLLFPAGGQTLQVLSITRLGPALTAAFSGMSPVFAVVPAILFLGEDFGLQGVLGLGLIMASLFYSAFGSRKITRSWPLWVLLIPLGASAARGIVQPFTKIGFQEIPSPYFATMLQATTSTILLLLILRLPAVAAKRRAGGQGWKWFCLTGLLNFFGIQSLNAAINLGAVTVVAPLSSTVPLWTLAYGVFLFRREKVGLRHLVIAVLVVSGVVLIVMR